MRVRVEEEVGCLRNVMLMTECARVMNKVCQVLGFGSRTFANVSATNFSRLFRDIDDFHHTQRHPHLSITSSLDPSKCRPRPSNRSPPAPRVAVPPSRMSSPANTPSTSTRGYVQFDEVHGWLQCILSFQQGFCIGASDGRLRKEHMV